MDEFRRRLIHLCHIPGITWNEIYRTLKSDSHLNDTLANFPQRNTQISFWTPTHNPSNQLQHSLPTIEKIIQQYQSKGIEIISYFDENYPETLKEIYQPPWCLFVKGNISLLSSRFRKLAIVGSRQATPYSHHALRHLLPPLINKNIIIVSGLAKGVDTLAHQSTIEMGGKTIAVIAGGFFHLYPIDNIELASLIAKDHLLISEYPPNSRPLRWQFPARNRIISGLCEGTLIIEAKRKSGSLITANFALQEGREVFAIPGSIFNPNSEGTNDLIQQGAKLIMCGKDILDELRPEVLKK